MVSYICDVCNSKFDSKIGLSNHRRGKCGGQRVQTSHVFLEKRRQDRETQTTKLRRIEEENAMQREHELMRKSIENDEPIVDPPISSPPAVPSSPQFRTSGLPERIRRLPKRFRDDLPPLPSHQPPILPAQSATRATLPDAIDSPEHDLLSGSHESPLDMLVDHDLNHSESETQSRASSPLNIRTEPDFFGVFRSYLGTPPTFDFGDLSMLSDVADSPHFFHDNHDQSQSRPWWSRFDLNGVGRNFFEPFRNATTYRLMQWFYGGSSQKSLGELDRLVNEVILAKDFSQEDLRDFRSSREVDRLDNYHGPEVEGPEGVRSAFLTSDGWQESAVNIHLPADGISHSSVDASPVFPVPGLFYKKIIDVMKSAFQEPGSRYFHLTPFELHYSPSSNKPSERIYSEIYNSPAMIEEHEKIRSQPRPNGCTLETVVASILLWSDSTHLANFGTASLWPIYLFFGNQSKYIRGKPSCFAAHHIAYIPKITDSLHDFYEKEFGKAITAEVLAHCRHELMQAIWLLLLDDEFMHAYEFGIVIEFLDGVHRRVFPRFFTYAADYPEKVLLACIKFLAQCPCPRCLTPKDKIGDIGSKADRRRRERDIRIDSNTIWSKINLVRKWIYEKSTSIVSSAVKRLLAPLSLKATMSAFSTRLKDFGVNFYTLFVPDLLHEFELGVWKAVFTHLLRVLHAHGDNTIQKLNRRFRKIPTFGRGTIRRFSNNASAMKRLAARDFEDLLQCAIPVFEQLLPAPFNNLVLDLLFELATWHGLAKLRMHTDSTLGFLDTSTTRLGKYLRRFVKETEKEYVTRDLPTEDAARSRRRASKVAKGQQASTAAIKVDVGPKIRRFNFQTYKLHALGDYVNTIRQFGTTDNYSTQPGELEHRRAKRFYSRVSKAYYTAGIAKQQQRERILFRMAQAEAAGKSDKGKSAAHRAKPKPIESTRLRFDESEPLSYSDPKDHYHIGSSNQYFINIPKWLGEHRNDPALLDFLPKLKDHILGRLLDRQYDGDALEFSPQQRSTVLFARDRIYRHKVLRINFTTYDLRRDQDSVNPRTHADVLAREEDPAHPYWYARILGVFHVMVIHTGEHSQSSMPQKFDFLWVRWFGLDPNNYQSGWRAKRLHRLGFIPHDAPGGAFGFLDPMEVIRAIHLIPAFAYGHTDTLLPPSIARPAHDEDKDWIFYYVNIFVDRDMLMRFRGGGVGHQSTREGLQGFWTDRDMLDSAEVVVSDDADDLDSGDSDDGGLEEGELEVPGSSGRAGEDRADEDEVAEEETEEALQEEMDEYGYEGIEEQELELEDAVDAEDPGEQPPVDEQDVESDDDGDGGALGPEDGEDDGVEEYGAYSEL